MLNTCSESGPRYLQQLRGQAETSRGQISTEKKEVLILSQPICFFLEERPVLVLSQATDGGREEAAPVMMSMRTEGQNHCEIARQAVSCPFFQSWYESKAECPPYLSKDL